MWSRYFKMSYPWFLSVLSTPFRCSNSLELAILWQAILPLLYVFPICYSIEAGHPSDFQKGSCRNRGSLQTLCCWCISSPLRQWLTDFYPIDSLRCHNQWFIPCYLCQWPWKGCRLLCDSLTAALASGGCSQVPGRVGYQSEHTK